MFLSDRALFQALENGDIKFNPKVSCKNVRPAGIRIRLSDSVFIPNKGMVFEMSNTVLNLDEYYTEQPIGDGFTLKPGDFVLSYSLEKFQTSNTLMPILDGRSTLARVGLTIHQTAFVIDNMHNEMRYMMLELRNEGVFDIVLKARAAVGMLLFTKMTDSISQIAQKQYSGLGDRGKAPNSPGSSSPYQLRLDDVE